MAKALDASLPVRQAGPAQGEAPAHRRHGRGRLPPPQGRQGRRLAAARALRRRGERCTASGCAPPSPPPAPGAGRRARALRGRRPRRPPVGASGPTPPRTRRQRMPGAPSRWNNQKDCVVRCCASSSSSRSPSRASRAAGGSDTRPVRAVAARQDAAGVPLRPARADRAGRAAHDLRGLTVSRSPGRAQPPERGDPADASSSVPGDGLHRRAGGAAEHRELAAAGAPRAPRADGPRCRRRRPDRTPTCVVDDADSSARSVASSRSEAASSLKPKSMIQAAPSSARNTLASRRSRWATRWLPQQRELLPHRASTSSVSSSGSTRSRDRPAMAS